MDENMVARIGRILALSPSRVEEMTFLQIIEQLVKDYETPYERKQRVYKKHKELKALWDKEYRCIATVDIRTYYRRVEVNGMTPHEAATTPRRNGNQFSRKEV